MKMIGFSGMIKKYADTPEVEFYNSLGRCDQKIVEDTYNRIMSKELKHMAHKSALELTIVLIKVVLRSRMEDLLKDVPASKREEARKLAEKELGLAPKTRQVWVRQK